MNLEGKNIFFTDITRMDTAPNTKGESIRLSAKIKKQIKKGDEKVIKRLIDKLKNMKHQSLLLEEFLFMA